MAKRDHAFPEGREADGVRHEQSALDAFRATRSRTASHAITATDYRWLKCDVKSTSLLGNCLLRQAAADAGALEVVMFRDGYLTEGSSSNVFVVKNGVILGAAKDNLVLPGITYDVVVELAQTTACRTRCGRVSEQTVRDADEIWVTSSTKEVLAVDDARWKAGRQRQARAGVPADAPALSGVQADGDAAGRINTLCRSFGVAGSARAACGRNGTP